MLKAIIDVVAKLDSCSVETVIGILLASLDWAEIVRSVVVVGGLIMLVH